MGPMIAPNSWTKPPSGIFTIQIIKRSDAAVGFEVIPRRWAVERTFASMTRWRRLVRDYEERIDCSEAMIHVALGSVLLRRIAPNRPFKMVSNTDAPKRNWDETFKTLVVAACQLRRWRTFRQASLGTKGQGHEQLNTA